jgi:hypothetical protein
MTEKPKMQIKSNNFSWKENQLQLI